MEADAKTSTFPLAAQRPGREEARPGPAPAWLSVVTADQSRDGPSPQAWGPWPPARLTCNSRWSCSDLSLPMLTSILQLNWRLPEGTGFYHLNPEPKWQIQRAWSPQGQQEVELSLTLHIEVHCTSAPRPELLSQSFPQQAGWGLFCL